MKCYCLWLVVGIGSESGQLTLEPPTVFSVLMSTSRKLVTTIKLTSCNGLQNPILQGMILLSPGLIYVFQSRFRLQFWLSPRMR